MLTCHECDAEYEDQEDGINCPVCGSPGGKSTEPAIPEEPLFAPKGKKK